MPMGLSGSGPDAAPPVDIEYWSTFGSQGSTGEPCTGVQGGISSVRYSGADVAVGTADSPVSQAAKSSSNVLSAAKHGTL